MKYLMVFMMLFVFSFGVAQRSSSFSSSSSRSYSSPSVSTRSYSAPSTSTRLTTPAPRTSVVPRATTAPRVTTPSNTRSNNPTVTQPARRTNFVPRVTPSQPLPRAVYAAGATRNGYHTHHYYSDYRSDNGFANLLPWFFLWDASDIGENDQYAPVVADEVGGVRWNLAVPVVVFVLIAVGAVVFLARLR